MNQEDHMSVAGASRRAVLAGGGAACLALLLGACGSDDAPDMDPAAGAAPTTGAAPTEGQPPTSAAPAAGGTVIAKAADVPKGGGMLAGTVLVVKLADGSVKAYDAHCPHKGVLVKTPASDKIECPAHHSFFKPEDGARISGPTTTGLLAIPVKVDGGNVVTA